MHRWAAIAGITALTCVVVSSTAFAQAYIGVRCPNGTYVTQLASDKSDPCKGGSGNGAAERRREEQQRQAAEVEAILERGRQQQEAVQKIGDGIRKAIEDASERRRERETESNDDDRPARTVPPVRYAPPTPVIEPLEFGSDPAPAPPRREIRNPGVLPAMEFNSGREAAAPPEPAKAPLNDDGVNGILDSISDALGGKPAGVAQPIVPDDHTGSILDRIGKPVDDLGSIFPTPAEPAPVAAPLVNPAPDDRTAAGRLIDNVLGGGNATPSSGYGNTLQHFAEADVRLSQDDAANVLRFFWSDADVTGASVTAEDRAFAQSLLVESLDASYKMGYVEKAFNAFYGPAPQAEWNEAKSAMKEFAKGAAKHWFKHATSDDLSDPQVYETVRAAVAAKFRTTWKVRKQTGDLIY